jgi:hypothetical protein
VVVRSETRQPGRREEVGKHRTSAYVISRVAASRVGNINTECTLPTRKTKAKAKGCTNGTKVGRSRLGSMVQ